MIMFYFCIGLFCLFAVPWIIGALCRLLGSPWVRPDGKELELTEHGDGFHIWVDGILALIIIASVAPIILYVGWTIVRIF